MNSVLLVDSATKLDPVGTEDAQSTGTSVDTMVVGVASRDASAGFAVGDPGLAASADIGGARAGTLSPFGSSNSPASASPSGGDRQLSVTTSDTFAGASDGGALSIAPGNRAPITFVSVNGDPGWGDATSDAGVSVGGNAEPAPGGASPSGATAGGSSAGGNAGAASAIAVGAVGGVSSLNTDGAVSGDVATSTEPSGSSSGGAATGNETTANGSNSDVRSGAVTASLAPETITLSGSGIVFNNSYGSGVTSAYRTAIIAAENFFQSHFTNAATFYVSFDLQPISNQFSAVNSYNPVNVSFSALEGALESHETTAADAAAVGSLFIADPSGGQGFAVPVGMATALGLYGPDILGLNEDAITLNSNLSWTFGQDAIGTIEHEMSEGIMGRIGGLGVQNGNWGPMDLFRYSAAGQRDYTGGLDGLPAYFSVDGTYLLKQFHNSLNTSGVFDGSDFADWNGTGDSFGAGGPGAPGVVTAEDLTILDILGWDRTSANVYTVGSGQTSNFTVIYSGDQALVQSGGTASSTFALSGGLEVVSAGGVESSGWLGSGAKQDVFGSAGSVVVSGGLQIVESGGTVSGTTVSDGGFETVSSGGAAFATTLLSGGTVEVFGGVFGGAFLSGLNWSAGTLALGSGYSVTDQALSDGQILAVLSSGFAEGTIVNAGGSAAVGVGGVTTSTTVNSGGGETVFGDTSFDTINAGGFDALEGGATSTTVSGGLLTIYESGGDAVSTTIDSGGVEIVYGIASFNTVNRGGTVSVGASGTTFDDTIYAGGREIVVGGFPGSGTPFEPGSATSAQIIGGLLTVSSGSEVSYDTVESGGLQIVSSGASASFDVIGSGGSETVLPGGSASFDTIGGGASLTVSSGGSVTGDEVSGGTLIVSASGIASSTTILGGGSLTVSSGGFVSFDTILSGGSQIVSAGGMAGDDAIRGGSETVAGGSVVDEFIFGSYSYNPLWDGGVLIVAAGGTATGTRIEPGGSETVLSGGTTIADELGLGGSLTVSSGGNAVSTFVGLSGGFQGGSLIVSSGGSATSATIWDRGSETVFGTASGTTLLFGGTLELFGGAVNLDFTWSGGTLALGSGYTLTSQTVRAGRTLAVLSGGVASDTTVLSGGGLVVDAGGIADPPTIDSGGYEVVSSGGVANGTVVSSGGFEYVLSGGDASGGVISSGGQGELPLTSANGQWSPIGANVIDGLTVQSGADVSLDIYQGGSISGFVVSSGFFEAVNSGGVAIGTVVIGGGEEDVDSGGVASGTVVSSGGSESVFGSGLADGSTIESGGLLTLYSGGSAGGTTTVSAGGSATVSSGGVAIAGSGAVLNLMSGAVFSGDISFGGSGGQLQIAGSAMPSGTVISGFTASGDAIDLTGLIFSGNTSVGFDSGTDILTVTEGGNSATIQLDSEDYTGISWVAGNDAGSGTDVMVACFLRGTLILTDHGEVPVEELAIGDEVMTRSGAVKPIRWIGRRSYDGRFIAGNRAVLPIRVAAGGLGEGVPARDLWLSPEHALAIEGVLVPAVQLVNGLTITQAEVVDRLEYFHVELEGHDIIFADGAPAETYVDCDNRFMFQNAGEFAALYPGDKRPAWDFCAARLAPGSPELGAIRAALLERAERLGYALDLDPDLHLVVDGAIVTALSVSGLAYRFEIPAGSSAIWLASRSAVPAEIEVVSRDRRRLGVAVERLVLGDGDLSIEAWHGHPALSDGFHDDEATHRWTDGLARLPDALLRPFAGAIVLELHLAPSLLAYPVSAPQRSDSRDCAV